ncbi:hypothetical protein NA57DRAFT_70470 [Rhizodiscina lignyota]|uniref:BZIP domain-containing protein n=1 Tax=Rhizodiscina lignyota TaxID=1504668 RepID=A0A9P4IR43_9PEZI|nr:hypothetical protein NA57DRAFT_70470 [Rhizodiscina lignyota]
MEELREPHKAAQRRTSRSKRGSGGRRDSKSSDTSRKSRATVKKEGDPNDGGLDTKQKRELDLWKNRQAAARCRQKQKEKTDELQAHARQLAAENAMLKESATTLKSQLLDLKTEGLKHTDCDCDGIRRFLIQGLDTLPPSSLTDDFEPNMLVPVGFDLDRAFRQQSCQLGKVDDEYEEAI